MAVSLQRLLTRGAKLRQIPVCPLLYCTRRTLFKLDYFEDFGVDRTDLILTLTKDYDLSRLGMQQKLKQMEMNHLIKDQRFKPERLEALGPDLAAANFIVARGGAVKFVDRDIWVKQKGAKLISVPNKFDSSFKVEGIDCSEMTLVYVGLDNLAGLEHLKYINLSNGKFVDDWFLARLHIYRDTLEFIDISGCANVTERGILSLHHLRNLKALRMNGCKAARNQEYIAVLMESQIPDLQIIGVDKSTDVLPKNVKVPERLQEDMKETDFQVLDSRILTMGDMLDDSGKKIGDGVKNFSVSLDEERLSEMYIRQNENLTMKDVLKGGDLAAFTK